MTNSLKTEPKIVKLDLLGIGSKRYLALLESVRSVIQRMELDIPINEIRDIDQILTYDIIGIPALFINGEFLYQTDVPTEEELERTFRQILQRQNV
jgi:phosphoenolpyruvate-protein kinase (PTS system EI component)